MMDNVSPKILTFHPESLYKFALLSQINSFCFTYLQLPYF
jgi:hypothetical protein